MKRLKSKQRLNDSKLYGEKQPHESSQIEAAEERAERLEIVTQNIAAQKHVKTKCRVRQNVFA